MVKSTRPWIMSKFTPRPNDPARTKQTLRPESGTEADRARQRRPHHDPQDPDRAPRVSRTAKGFRLLDRLAPRAPNEEWRLRRKVRAAREVAGNRRPSRLAELCAKALARSAGTLQPRARWGPSRARDGGISERKRPMERENKRQVDTQSDGRSGEGVAANHAAPVSDRIASQNEPHSEPGRYHPSRAEREKARRSDLTGLRMRRDPERSAPAKQDGAAVDPSQEAMAIPAAFTEARDKLQRTRQQGDRATQGVQRKRTAPLAEVVQFGRKGHLRQQVTKSPPGRS
jgi:hypothetical protein